MNGELGKQYLESYIASTDDAFVHYLDSEIEKAKKVGAVPAEILSRYAKTARLGKKIRGGLMQLGYEIGGGTDIDSIQRASFCMELFHAGILVHDDIQDQDMTRRGLRSIHKQLEDRGREMNVRISPSHYGISQAINVADVAMYLSWRVLLESNFSPEVLLQTGRIYARYVARLGYGQMLDLANTTSSVISEDAALTVIKYKTAEYTGVLPLLMGATIAGGLTKSQQEALINYGLNFGWAFQIQDDLLDLFGEDSKIGKDVGSDIAEGKQTLLMIYLSKLGTDDDRAFVQRTLGKDDVSEDELNEMRDRVKASGAYEHVVALGWEYVEKGKRYIDQITENKKHQEILESLIVYMMERAS